MTSTEDALCPYCGQQNQIPIDVSAGGQKFTTDCEVCCRPFDVRVEFENGQVVAIEVS